MLGAPGVSATVNSPPVTGPQWKSVFNDWFAYGRFTESHSCAAAVVARTHAPPLYPEGTPFAHALDLYEIAVCPSPGNPGAVKVGMSNREVADIAGVPVPWLSSPQSWDYRKPGDGIRIDFTAAGYVERIGHAMQGLTTA